MMILPKTFVDGFKNKTVKQCISERDNLYLVLKQIENDEFTEDELDDTACPANQYDWYLEVFAMLNDLIWEKFDNLEDE